MAQNSLTSNIDNEQSESTGIRHLLERNQRLWLTIFVAALVLLLVVTVIGGYVLKWEWTGIGGSTRAEVAQDMRVEESMRTLWDWLQVLIVPAVLAAGGLWFTWRQTHRDKENQQEQKQREKESAEQRAQDTALQAYLDKITSLLVDKGLVASLLSSNSDSANRGASIPDGHVVCAVRKVVEAQTLAVLLSLDGTRKRSVLRLVYALGLIRISDEPSNESDRPPALDLSDADLDNANLRHAVLMNAYLRNVFLRSADLSSADLRNVDLSRAYLNHANLIDAKLINANLSYADLSGADLSGAHLSGANLSYTDLSGADLSGASLSGAVLRGTKLREATGLSQEQIGQAMVGRGATLPGDLWFPEAGEATSPMEQSMNLIEQSTIPDISIL